MRGLPPTTLQWGRDGDADWRVKNLKSSVLVAFTVLCTIDDVPVAAVEHYTSPQVLVFKLPPPPPPLAIVIAQLEQSGHNIHLVNLIQRIYNKTLIILPYIIMDTHLHTIIRPVTIARPLPHQPLKTKVHNKQSPQKQIHLLLSLTENGCVSGCLQKVDTGRQHDEWIWMYQLIN